MGSLTLSSGAADTNLGMIKYANIGYAGGRAAGTLALGTSLLQHLSTSLIGSNDIRNTPSGAQPSGEPEGWGVVTVQGRCVHRRQRDDEKRQKDIRGEHLGKPKGFGGTK